MENEREEIIFSIKDVEFATSYIESVIKHDSRLRNDCKSVQRICNDIIDYMMSEEIEHANLVMFDYNLKYLKKCFNEIIATINKIKPDLVDGCIARLNALNEAFSLNRG